MVTLPTLPALAVGTVRHERRTPLRHGLRFGTHLWLVDLDALPHLPPVVSFPVGDHFAGGTATIKEALTAFVAEHGIAVQPTDRMLMLSAGRSFGHAFDPLSVFWLLDAQGDLRCAVLEIHNTYGDRHAHVVHPDARGRARIAKQFYVSPFFSVDGHYDVQLVLDERRIATAITLEQDGDAVFHASFVGRPVPATPSHIARALLRTPFATLQTTVRIRIHGIWLWLRRLPVIPRPVHETQAGFR